MEDRTIPPISPTSRFDRISIKLSKFAPSLTLALKADVEARRAKGLPVYDFGLGETKGHLDPVIREAGEKAFREEHTMYADPGGIPPLRKAILRWLGVDDIYTEENVVVTAGAKQALFNIFLAVGNTADVFLFDAAPWVSYQPLTIASYNVPVMVLPKTESNRLKITPQDLLRNIRMRPHARLFLLNNPVNPTAQLYSPEVVSELVHICAEHRIFFVLDRLYWKILFDGNKFPEPPLNEKTLPWVIQVDGMSKNFRRAGGLRVGWTVGPTDITKAMINLQSHYTSGVSVPTQRVALAALTHRYDDSLISDLQKKRDLIFQDARRLPWIEVWETPAAFYSFWDVRKCFGKKTPHGKILKDSDGVAAYLCEQGGVVTASGSGFMQDGFLRLAFDVPEEEIRHGMAAAKTCLEQLQ